MSNNITIKINTDNAAFEDNPNELEDILNKVITKVNQGEESFSLMDTNGNTVGSVETSYESEQEMDI